MRAGLHPRLRPKISNNLTGALTWSRGLIYSISNPYSVITGVELVVSSRNGFAGEFGCMSDRRADQHARSTCTCTPPARSQRDTNAGEYNVNVEEYSRSREEQTRAGACNRHSEALAEALAKRPSPKPYKIIILLQVRMPET